MKGFTLIITFLFSLNAFSHGGDDGPSSLETEFAKLSHIHLPMNYSTHHGMSYGYEVGSHVDEEVENKDENIELNIHPVFFGGFDKLERLTCLENSQSGKIETCRETSPYLLLENKKWDLGLGGELDIHLSIPGVSAGAGISYIKGKNYFSVRMLNYKSEKRSKLQLPTHISAAYNWRIGDQLTYMSKGSIVLSAFIGIEPFFHVGPEFIHTGVHKISVKKITPHIFQVEVALLKSNGLGVEANGIVLNAEASKSLGKSKNLVYEFDIYNPNVFLALNSLFEGRLDITHKLLLESKGSILLKNLTTSKGQSLSGNFGLAALFFNGGTVGTYSTVSDVEIKEENEMHLHKLYSVAHIKEHFTRGFLSNHLFLNRALFTTIVKEDHEDDSMLSATYSWSLSKDKLSGDKLKEKIRKSLFKLGLKNIPPISFGHNQKGYLKADVSLGLSGGQVLKLLNLANLAKLKTIGLSQIEGKIKKINFFKKHQNLIQKRNLIEETYADKNYVKLNKHLNAYLNVFFNSEFHIQAFLSNNLPHVAEINIEGEYFKKTKVKLLN
jgi:hypothetical protein